MPGINRIPGGLLGLLGLKSLGRNPDTLLSDVRPTVDLMRLYMTGQPQMVTSIVGVTGNGFLTPIVTHTVPNGKCWFVIGHAVEGLSNPGTVAQFAAAAGYPLGAAGVVTPQWAASTMRVYPVNAGRNEISTLIEAALPSNPFVAAPGCQFGAYVAVTTLVGGEQLLMNTAFFEFDF